MKIVSTHNFFFFVLFFSHVLLTTKLLPQALVELSGNLNRATGGEEVTSRVPWQSGLLKTLLRINSDSL